VQRCVSKDGPLASWFETALAPPHHEGCRQTWRRTDLTRRANHLAPHALIWPPCPAPSEKIFCFSEVQITAIVAAVLSHQEGRWPTSLTRGRMRWTRVALWTKAFSCGRRSRVVLTPRRWCQVGGSNSASDGGQKARAPGSARIIRKPLRGECRVIPVYPTNACAFLLLHGTRGYRAHRPPGIPCALCLEGGNKIIPRAKKSMRRDREGVACRHCERSETIHRAPRK
jgi:hypothetical protein